MMLGSFPMASLPMSSLPLTRTVTASAGAYAVTGMVARFAVRLTGTSGAYATTGQTARFAVRLRGAVGAYLLTGYEAVLRYVDNLRLRGRDHSGPQYQVRDESEGYW